MQLSTRRSDLLASEPAYRCNPLGSGHLSGSWVCRDDAGILEIKDSAGSSALLVVYMPATLVISSLPPSGCAFSTFSCLVPAFRDFASRAITDAWSSHTHERLFGSPIASRSPHSFAAYVDPARKEATELVAAIDPTAQPLVRSHQQLVRSVQDSFGLNTTDLANLLGVSRQSVHSWRSDTGSAPGKSSVSKLTNLLNAANAWHKVFPPTGPGWLLHSTIRGRTLIKWLESVANGSTEIGEVVAAVSEALSATSRPRPPKATERPPTAFESLVEDLKDLADRTGD
jgi:hypothetical protein